MSLQFRNIELNDRALIESYIKPYRFENSEFSFAYLMMWGLEGQITMAEENNVLYLRFCYPNTPVFMLPPIPQTHGVILSCSRCVTAVPSRWPVYRRIIFPKTASYGAIRFITGTL